MERFFLDCSEPNFNDRFKEIALKPIKCYDIIFKNVKNKTALLSKLKWINYNYTLQQGENYLIAIVDNEKLFSLKEYMTTDTIVRHLPHSDKYLVNLGANDGISYNDPCYPLYKRGYKGLAIDFGNYEVLRENLPEQVDVLKSFITTDNIISLLNYTVPVNCDLIKIDIDSCDGEILKAILKGGYTPKVIDIEINPEIPPSVKYSLISSTTNFVKCGLFGCSSAYVIDLGKKYGYEFFQLNSGKISCVHDVVLLRKDIMKYFKTNPKDLNIEFRKNRPVPVRMSGYGINPSLWEQYGINLIKKDIEFVANQVEPIKYILYK